MRHVARTADPTLDAIVHTVVEHFQPNRIVLFGSRARGDAGENSDYDLMIEVDDARNGKLDTAISVLLFELDFDVDAVVTTADAYARDREDVGLLAYQIEREGKVLYSRGIGAEPPRASRRAVRERRPPRPRSVAMWVRRAENDFEGAQRMVAGSPMIADAVCFHAHQSAEKYLKAVIVWTGRPPQRTHRLGRLLKRCPLRLRRHAGVRHACAVLLAGYRYSRYAETREPTEDEARSAAEAAAVVRQVVREVFAASR